MIYVPEYLWSKAIASLRSRWKVTERVVYLDGFRLTDYGVATTITVPDAILGRGNFRVTAEAMSAAGEHLAEFNMRRLAQLHTHGNQNVYHSDTDDTFAYSQREGAVSIVVPFYARKRVSLNNCGVHVCHAGRWKRVSSQEELQSTLQLIPSCINFYS